MRLFLKGQPLFESRVLLNGTYSHIVKHTYCEMIVGNRLAKIFNLIESLNPAGIINWHGPPITILEAPRYVTQTEWTTIKGECYQYDDLVPSAIFQRLKELGFPLNVQLKDKMICAMQ